MLVADVVLRLNQILVSIILHVFKLLWSMANWGQKINPTVLGLICGKNHTWVWVQEKVVHFFGHFKHQKLVCKILCIMDSNLLRVSSNNLALIFSQLNLSNRLHIRVLHLLLDFIWSEVKQLYQTLWGSCVELIVLETLLQYCYVTKGLCIQTENRLICSQVNKFH